jgi:shikimate dehydrogenase
MDGQTQLVGVMGWPIAHTLSPAMHNAAFRALDMNWAYVPLAVPPAQVGAAVAGLRALGFRGCNVTVPHKEAVIAHLDRCPPRVARFGAVNTLIVERDEDRPATVAGENTDVQGFICALRRGGFEPQGRRVLVIGAGGAARGVVFSLCSAGAAAVTVVNRTLARAERLVADLEPLAGGTRLEAGALSRQALARGAEQAELLVHTTSLGMWPHAQTSIWPADLPYPPHLALCDLVYRPEVTRIMQQAQAAGAWTLGGLGMLVEQAALSFEMWTGVGPPVDVMWAACAAELEGRA